MSVVRAKKRGFVGPLGDDIPSIFPIVAAVLLFIGTVLYANMLVDQKNKELELRQAVLGLSYIVTEKGLVVNRAEFKDTTCEDHLKKFAVSHRISFIVTIKKFCKKIEFYSQDSQATPAYYSQYYLEEFGGDKWDASQGRTWAYCTNQEKGGRVTLLKKNQQVQVPGLFPVPESAITLVYPVAVRCEVSDMPTNGMGLIYVIGWK